MGQPRSQPSCDTAQAKALMKLPLLPNDVERVVASFGKPEGLSLNNEKPEPQSKGAAEQPLSPEDMWLGRKSQ